MKKTLSIILCILMLVSAMSVLAYAKTINTVCVEVNEPVEGEAPDFNPVITTSGNLEISSVVWVDASTNDTLTSSDCFEAGRTYQFVVGISITGSDNFDDEQTELFINGYYAELDSLDAFDLCGYTEFEIEGSSGDDDNALINTAYEIAFSIAPGEPVRFDNFIQYGEGKHIDKTYNDDGFVNGVKWSSPSMGSAHKKGDRYNADTEYTLSLRIVADGECYFPTNAGCKLFCNFGEGMYDATIIDWDSKYIVAEFELPNNSCPSKGWNKASDGKWLYYYTDEGDCYTNCWQKIGGKWYHFDASGAMQTGWQKISGKWYYFNKSGVMLTGWQKISSKWYYFNSSGAMLTGWQKISKKWYFFESSGAMKTGWKKSGGKWYYLGSDGAMLVSCSKKIGKKTYKFNSSGVCTNP